MVGRVLTDTASAPGVAVLPGVAPGGTRMGRCMVGARGAPRGRPRRRVGRVRLARRRRRPRRVPRRAAHAHRRAVHRLDGAAPDAPARERQPRQPDGRPPLRPSDGRNRRTARARPPRATRAGRRPGDGPRLRPRHDGASAVDLDGLRRQRSRAARDRHRRRPAAVRLHLVGPVRTAAGVGEHPLAPARERRLEGPQHRRGPHRPAPRRLLVPSRGRCGPGQGAAAVRSGRLGDRPLRRHPHPAVRPAVPRDPAAREVGGCVPRDRGRRQRRGVLGDRPGSDRRRSVDGSGGRVRPGRDRRVGARVRRSELGARRRGRAGGRARTVGGRRGPCRCAAPGRRGRSTVRRGRAALPRRLVRLRRGASGARRVRPHRAGRLVDRDRRA